MKVQVHRRASASIPPRSRSPGPSSDNEIWPGRASLLRSLRPFLCSCNLSTLNLTKGKFLSALRLILLLRNRSKTELPPPNIRRWTFGHKGAVLEVIRRGAITAEETRERYGLSVEELDAWQRDFERHGLYGLRATRLQVYRGEKRNLIGSNRKGLLFLFVRVFSQTLESSSQYK